MTKPNDIPQDVWDKAMSLHGDLKYDEVALRGGTISEIMEACNADAELIARAIMAAKEEEREECAGAAYIPLQDFVDDLRDGIDPERVTFLLIKEVQSAICNRKLANNTNKD